MKGEMLHNEILTRRLQQVAESCGATTLIEHPVLVRDHTHHIDLLIRHQGLLTACESETSPARVGADVLKAEAVGARDLVIATPDALTAQACRRKLRRLRLPKSNLKVIVCPLGAALEILQAILTEQTNRNSNERES